MNAIKAFFGKAVVKYAILGVVAAALIGTGVFFAVRHFRAPVEPVANTTAEIPTDDGEYTIVTEPDTTVDPLAVTDEFGSAVTDANGVIVTKTPASTVKKPTTKKVTTTKKPTSSGSSSAINEGDKVGTNSTVHKNPDGSINVVKEDGSIALSYSYDATGNYFYTDSDPWQRQFGFNKTYDIGAAVVSMYYDTIRVKFSYGKYDWMVQMWKGQYGLLFLGSEIGLYYKEKGKVTDHYNCATKDMELNMQMTLYREGAGELFTRPYAKHWWTTAFVPGKLKKFNDRSELTMVGKIDFGSEGMRKAFCAALEKVVDPSGNKFKYASKVSKDTPETYTYRNNVVDLVWRYLDEDRKITTTTKKPTTPPTTVERPTEKPTYTAPSDPIIITPTTKAPTTAAPTEAPSVVPPADPS